MLIFTAICSVIGLFSNYYWFFDLFNNFRPQAIIVGVILLTLMLIIRNYKYAILALAIITLNSTIIYYKIYNFNKNAYIAQSTTNSKTISIISANVLAKNNDYTSFVELIKKQQPDIFVVIEANYKRINSLNKIENLYPYTIKHPLQNNFGMAIYSKIPFKGNVIKTGKRKLPLIIANFKNFKLITLHPTPPVSKEYSEDIYRYFAKVTKIADKTTLPLIVAGDLNTTLWSDNIIPFKDAGLISTNPTGIAWTWPNVLPILPFAMQIDHIFIRGAHTKSFNVLLDNIGSDHHAIKAEINIPTTK